MGVLAKQSSVASRTRAPAARSPGTAFSAGLWLMPRSQGTKIMPVGQISVMKRAS